MLKNIFFIGLFFFNSFMIANQFERLNFPDTSNFHNNNNLWTGFDYRNGDFGDRNTAAFEFPGGSEINHLLRGCHIIGYIDSIGDTTVVSNKL